MENRGLVLTVHIIDILVDFLCLLVLLVSADFLALQVMQQRSLNPL